MLSVDGFDGSRNIRAFIFNLFVLFVWSYHNLNKINLFGLSLSFYIFSNCHMVQYIYIYIYMYICIYIYVYIYIKYILVNTDFKEILWSISEVA